LARDLIFLQQIMLNCNLLRGLSSSVTESIRSTFLPRLAYLHKLEKSDFMSMSHLSRTVVMAHSYFVLVWVTETPATTPPPDAL